MAENNAKDWQGESRRMTDKLRGKVTEEERKAYDALMCELYRVKDRRVRDNYSGDSQAQPEAEKPLPEKE